MDSNRTGYLILIVVLVGIIIGLCFTGAKSSNKNKDLKETVVQLQDEIKYLRTTQDPVRDDRELGGFLLNGRYILNVQDATTFEVKPVPEEESNRLHRTDARPEIPGSRIWKVMKDGKLICYLESMPRVK